MSDHPIDGRTMTFRMKQILKDIKYIICFVLNGDSDTVLFMKWIIFETKYCCIKIYEIYCFLKKYMKCGRKLKNIHLYKVIHE